MKNSILLTILCVLIGCEVNAQGKYFEVISEKANVVARKYNGGVVLQHRQKYVSLDYPGKTQKQLTDAILVYLKKYPNLKLNKQLSNSDLIVYRDFSEIGGSVKCSAELVGKTQIYAALENGIVKLSFGKKTVIYSSNHNAVLRITPEDDVASENEVPFNVYQYVQPEGLKEAFPESVYDEDGKLVNPTVKKVIEDYYDSYVIGLKDFLDQYFK